VFQPLGEEGNHGFTRYFQSKAVNFMIPIYDC
jgi:hypothetical protein